MTALELLKTLRTAGDEIDDINDQIAMRQSAATFITAHYGEEGGGGSSAPGDKFANYAANVGDLREKLIDRKKRWTAEMEYCIQLADTFDGLERMIVFNYYGRAWTVAAIAKSAGYTEGAVKKTKSKVDAHLAGIIVEIYQMPDWYWKELIE